MSKTVAKLLSAIALAAMPIVPRLAAATYEVGPSLAYTNLGSVPWTGLQPGDTVNVHYQAGGYHEIILLSASGVSNAPITLNGVPDPVTGALPTLDGSNAVTATNTPWHDPSLNTEGVIVVSPNALQPYPYFPSGIVIQNLRVQNASPSNSLTQAQGGTASFDSTAAAIYVEFAQHLVVSGCELSGSCNGFFCGAENGDPNTTSADILVQKSWVHGNGFPGNYEAHNINTEAKGIVFQYNLIGPLMPNASGDDIKDASSGTILRYNMVIQGPGGWAFWFVQPDGGVGVIDQDPAYHTNFVYGNVFLNGTNSSALTMFAYDYLGNGSHPRNGTLYFYNNTVVNYADQSARYYTEIFQLPQHQDAVALNIHDVVDCRNNIFAALPATAGRSPTQTYLLNTDDGTLLLGTNWVSPGLVPLQLPYGATNFYGAIIGTNQLIFGDHQGQNNPGFVSVPNTNFMLLSSSACIDAAGPQSPAVLASPNNVVAQYVPPTNGQVRIVSGRGMDLGAFEGVSTNYSGPLFSLTVTNGFGTGNYPSNAAVLIAASNAPAGQVFAGWTGYPVPNVLSVGTTLSMPASNISVTATYSNLPYYGLTVSNGTGSGSYLPGSVVAIAANPPPAGQVFAAWIGYPVASPGAPSTTLTTPAGNVTVTATYSNAAVTSLFYLTVVNGSGSGSYAAGTTVNITANTPGTNQTFAGWTGYTVANAAALSTSLVMPSNNVTVAASYQFTGPLPSTLPQPVSSHPRLWLTTNDLAKYRSWAVQTNPIYQQGLRIVIQQCVSDYQAQFFPGGVANTNYPDFGDTQGYTGLLTEADAVILSFASLIDPDPVKRSQYAQYSRNLLMYALSQAALGTLANAPFRDPLFATYNRANGGGEDWPLAVDWIYSATDMNGQPVLSAADKLTIRNAFMVWAGKCLTASTTGGDSPTPVGVLNSQQLLPNGNAYRMAANNYYIGHARLMTMMALALDPADDPLVNTNLSVSVLGNSLRSYLDDAVGAWLYQQYAMFGDAPSVITNYGLASNASVGLASGGLPPEGMLYGHSIGFLLGQLLALQTAGYNNPNLIGPQAAMVNSPVWGRFSTAMLSSLVPAAQVFPSASYLGPVYQMDSYGDLLRLWTTPESMIPLSLQALLEQSNGATNHLAATRWFLVNGVEGGSAALLNRVANPWSYGVDQALLYFMLLDPGAPPAPDPRPGFPLAFQDVPLGRIIDRTAWKSNATQFDFLANWISINHQQASAGQFEFYRNGEWLTKEVSNYDDNLNGQSSMWHNTLVLQNWCSAGDPNLSWGETLFLSGSEYMLGEAAGDPVTATSSSPSYTYASADLTPLFNLPNVWQPQISLTDIQQATRNIIWVKPDHIVVYDRAASAHTGLFKRFNLNFIATPSLAGNTITEVTPGGQKLFVQTVLPANATITYVPLGNSLTTVAELEPSVGRVVIEDTNHPVNTRFLHVLQGAASNAVPDAVAHVANSSGNAFDGVTVRGVVVLFPVNVLSNTFTSLTYTVPNSVTDHYIAGLTPGASYAISQSTIGGSQQVTVTTGPGLPADGAGLLSFNNAGQTLSGAPRFVSAVRAGSNLHLTGTGMANLNYSILTSTNLASTNWAKIGTATADSSGNFQFTDSTASTYPQRFYRASWP
ncbi:MAG: hypothetical protein C5B50_27290 [Verrucomicrobia bacterium]|nr:MAG: hypothetical protein C5B50_27290 [Verrucomicrobiota bacterium]